MPLPLRATYRLSEAEFMNACELHWKARGQGAAMGTGIGLAAVLLGAFLAWRYPFGLTYKLSLAIVALGGLFPVVILIRGWIWRRAYRGAKKFHDNITIAFDEDTIHVETAAGVSDLNWGAYNRFREFGDFFILYISAHNFSVIPSSAFAESDRDELRALLKRKLAP